MAQTKRTSSVFSCEPPTGMNWPVWINLRSFAWSARSISQISSRKRGAAVGQFRRTLAPVGGAGERALFVAEDLAFHELARDRAAVERDHRLVAPRAQLVNGFGTQFLAGPAFASEKDRCLRRGRARDRLVQFAHRAGRPDQLVSVLRHARLRRRALDRFRDPGAECPVHRRAKLGAGDRLYQEVVRAEPHDLDRLGERPLGAENDDGGVPEPVARIAEGAHRRP